MSRPFLRWAGGKTQVLSNIEEVWPDTFGRYFEPFLGGGSVYFHFRPPRSTLSDLNPDLINSFVHVRDEPWRVLRMFRPLADEYVTAPDKGRSEIYYRNRASFRAARPESCRRAALFLFLNRTCWNALWRVNSAGVFNVPHGRPRLAEGLLLEVDKLLAASEALQGTRLVCASYEEVIQRAKRGDLIYLDPPYMASDRELFDEYHESRFGFGSQESLAETAADCANRGMHVIVSNSADTLIRDLFESRGFDTLVLSVKRTINRVGSERTGHKEALYLSPSVGALLSTRRLF